MKARRLRPVRLKARNKLNKAQVRPKNVVDLFDLRGDVVSRVTGHKMDVNLLSVNGKYYADSFGKLRSVGANTPRHDGNGIILSGEISTLLAYSNQPNGTGIWANPATAGEATHTLTENVAEAPNGKMEAFRWQAATGGDLFANWAMLSITFGGLTNPHNFSCSGWFKSADGNEYTILFYNNSGTLQTITIDGTWRYFKFKDKDIATTEDHFRIMLRGETGCSPTCDILGWGITPALIYGDPFTHPTYGEVTTMATEAGAADNGISLDTVNKFPGIADILSSEGTMVLDFEHIGGDGALEDGENAALISFNNSDAGFLFLKKDPLGDTYIRSHDGTTLQSRAATWFDGIRNRVVISWGGGARTLAFWNGVEWVAATSAFEGAYENTGIGRLHYSNEQAVKYGPYLTWYNTKRDYMEFANV
jgi:hypothetical protein